MKMYRIKPYDLMNDIYILEKRVFLFFWIPLGCGSKEEVIKKRDLFNGPCGNS